jgi:hypothetical protein
MALDASSILLALGAGTVEGIEKAQERREKELEKRIKTLTSGPNVELAKSKHKEAYKEYSDRKNKISPLMAIGNLEQREMQYAMDVRGMSYDEFVKAKQAGHDFQKDVSNEALQAQIGDEPIASYMTEEELAAIEAPSVLRGMGATFGIGERDKSIDQQIEELRAKKQARATPAQPTRSAKVEPTSSGGIDYSKTEKVPEWKAKQDAEIKWLVDSGRAKDITEARDMYYMQSRSKVNESGIIPPYEQSVTGAGAGSLTYGVSEVDMRRRLKRISSIPQKELAENAAKSLVLNSVDSYKTEIENEDQYKSALKGTTMAVHDQLKLEAPQALRVAEYLTLANVDKVKQTENGWFGANAEYNPTHAIPFAPVKDFIVATNQDPVSVARAVRYYYDRKISGDKGYANASIETILNRMYEMMKKGARF